MAQSGECASAGARWIFVAGSLRHCLKICQATESQAAIISNEGMLRVSWTLSLILLGLVGPEKDFCIFRFILCYRADIILVFE